MAKRNYGRMTADAALSLFRPIRLNLTMPAIDSKLRGCDVVSLRLEDVAPHGHAVDRATVRQKKTGQPVRFEMTEQTREAVDSYIGATSKKPAEFLFSSRRGRDRPITTRQYARLVCQ
jgi:integrase